MDVDCLGNVDEDGEEGLNPTGEHVEAKRRAAGRRESSVS